VPHGILVLGAKKNTSAFYNWRTVLKPEDLYLNTGEEPSIHISYESWGNVLAALVNTVQDLC